MQVNLYNKELMMYISKATDTVIRPHIAVGRSHFDNSGRRLGQPEHAHAYHINHGASLVACHCNPLLATLFH